MPARGPVVLVLASGKGERFIASGGQGSKLQALLAGRPVLERTLDAVKASGLRWHVEDAGHPGMGDSIAAAVRATRDAEGWLVLPGDLPLVRPQTLRAVAAALAGRRWWCRCSTARAAIPSLSRRSCGAALAALSGPKGAAAVMQANRVTELPVDDEGVVTDIDTVEALARAAQVLAGRNG
jgi:molybdenum cofactor cytidylyltransferase